MSSWSSGSSRTSITSGGRPRPTSNLLSELTAAGYKIDSTTGSIRTISSVNSSPPQSPDQMSPDLVSPRTHMSTVLEKRAAGGSDGSGDRSDDSQNHVSGSGGKSSGGEDPSEGVDSSSGGGESTGGDGSSSDGMVTEMPNYPIPFVQPKPTLDDPFYIMGGALPQGHLLRNYPESAPPRETVESKVEAQIVKIEFLKGQPLTEAEKNKLRQSIIGTYGEAWLNDAYNKYKDQPVPWHLFKELYNAHQKFGPLVHRWREEQTRMLNNLVTKKDPEKPEQEYVTQESLQALLKAKDSNIDALNDKVAEFQRYSDSVEALWKEASGENRNLRLMFTKSYAKDFDRTEAERERKKIEILQKLDDLRRERNRLQIQLQRRQQDSDDFHVETKKVHQQLQAEIDNYRKKVVSLREELDNAEAQSRQTEEEDRTMIQELHTKLKKLQSKEGEGSFAARFKTQRDSDALIQALEDQLARYKRFGRLHGRVENETPSDLPERLRIFKAFAHDAPALAAALEHREKLLAKATEEPLTDDEDNRIKTYFAFIMEKNEITSSYLDGRREGPDALEALKELLARNGEPGRIPGSAIGRLWLTTAYIMKRLYGADDRTFAALEQAEKYKLDHDHTPPQYRNLLHRLRDIFAHRDKYKHLQKRTQTCGCSFEVRKCKLHTEGQCECKHISTVVACPDHHSHFMDKHGKVMLIHKEFVDEAGPYRLP